MLVQTSSKRQIKRETRPDCLATRIPFFFFILESLLPGGVAKLRTNALPLLAPDLTVINSEFFYLARSFGGLIKPNCGTNVSK